MSKMYPAVTPLTLVLPKGWLESDPSYLGNLKYIICGHFDGKNRGTGGGGKVRWRVRGDGCHLRKLKVAILKKKV